jgi:hypothetical protein
MKVLSIRKVLEYAGGSSRLQETLYRAGQPYPSDQRLSNWKARGSIPGAWAGAIIWALACKGVNPLKLLDDTRG